MIMDTKIVDGSPASYTMSVVCVDKLELSVLLRAVGSVNSSSAYFLSCWAETPRRVSSGYIVPVRVTDLTALFYIGRYFEQHLSDMQGFINI